MDAAGKEIIDSLPVDDAIVSSMAALSADDLARLLADHSSEIRLRFFATNGVHSVRSGAYRLLRTNLLKAKRAYRLQCGPFLALWVSNALQAAFGGSHADPTPEDVRSAAEQLIESWGAGPVRLALATIASEGMHAAAESYAVLLSSESFRLPSWPLVMASEASVVVETVRPALVGRWSHDSDCRDEDDRLEDFDFGDGDDAPEEEVAMLIGAAEGSEPLTGLEGDGVSELKTLVEVMAAELPSARAAATRVVDALTNTSAPMAADLTDLLDMRALFVEATELARRWGIDVSEEVTVEELRSAVAEKSERLTANAARMRLWRRAATATGAATAAVSQLRTLAEELLAGSADDESAQAVELVVRHADAVAADADDSVVLDFGAQIETLCGDRLNLIVLASTRRRLLIPPDPGEFDPVASSQVDDPLAGQPTAPLDSTEPADVVGDFASVGAVTAATGNWRADEAGGEDGDLGTDAAVVSPTNEEGAHDVRVAAAPPNDGADIGMGAPEDAEADLELNDEHAVRAVTARAIAAGRFGLAYWLIRAEDRHVERAEVLAITAFACSLRSANGSCAIALRDAIQHFDPQTVDGDRTAQLLLLGAISRASVLVPSTTIAPLQRYLSVTFDSLPNLAALIKAFERATYAGVQVVADYDSGVAAVATIEQALEARAGRARRLLADGPSRNIKFTRATDIWREWIEPKGPIGELLTKVAASNLSAADSVQTALDALHPPKGLERLLQDADRRRRSSPHPAKLTAGARLTLLDWAEDALDSVADWLQDVRRLQAATEASDLSGALVDLRRSVADHAISAAKELRHWVGRIAERDAYIDAPGTMTALILDGTYRLLNGEPLIGEEVVSAEVLGRELLLVPDLRLDGFVPLRPPTTVELLDVENRTYEEAFAARAELGDHVGTALILDVLRRTNPQQADDLELRRIDLVAAQRAAVADLHSVAKREVGRARRLGSLDDDRFAFFRDKLDVLDVDQRLDFGVIREELQAIRVDLTEREKSARAETLAALDATLGAHPELNVVEERVRDLIENQGDLATAEEVLLLARLGEFDDSGADIDEPFRIEEFFPAIPQALSERALDETAASAAEAGDQWGPFDFGALTAEERDRAGEGILAWWRLGSGAFKGKKPRLDPCSAHGGG
jgi:hypothetical protein